MPRTSWSFRRILRLPDSPARTKRLIEDEIAFHIEGRVEQFVAAGMSRQDAEVEARRRFGAEDVIRASIAAVAEPAARNREWRERVADSWADLRIAVRSLRRRPAFSLTVAAILTVGIGSSVAMYGIIDGVLLRPLPYAEPDQLVTVYTTFPHWKARPVVGPGWDALRTPYVDYRRLAADTLTFRGLAGFSVGEESLTIGGETLPISEGSATANLMEVLGTRVRSGRWFLPGEDGPAASHVTVLSHELWVSRFDRRDVIGQSIHIGEEHFTVVGILPPRFSLAGVQIMEEGRTRPADLWTPVGVYPSALQPGNHTLELIGRLRPGVTPELASAVAGRVLRGDQPAARRGGRAVLRMETETSGLRRPLRTLFGAVLVLLLITAANVASLFLAETGTREVELRTRSVLGASRSRLVRLLLMESSVLSAASSVMGLVVGWWLLRLLVHAAPIDLPRANDIAISWRVAAFAIGIGSLAALVAGLAPAITYLRPDLARPAGGTWIATGRSRLRLVVLAAQSALAVMLIAGAALLARSLVNEASVDPGFGTDKLVLVQASLPRAAIDAAGGRAPAYQRLASRLATLPDVGRIAGVSMPPLGGRTNGQSISILPATGTSGEVERMIVTANYFDLLGIRLIEGRGFFASDTVGGQPVAIVSEAFARRFWGDGSVVGRQFKHPNGVATIVGVVGDVRNRSLDRSPEAVFYQPLGQGSAEVSFILEVRGEPRSSLPALQRAIWRDYPGTTVDRAITMADLRNEALAPSRYRATIAGVFAGIALLLTATGIGGLAARGVSTRLPEFCIRLALGAPGRGVTMLAMRDGLLTVAGGVIAGLVGARLSAPLLIDYLFAVPPRDVASLTVTCVATLATCVGAMWVALRRLRHASIVSVLRAG